MYITTTPITEMKNAYIVEGKNVVVTGGNRGIGRGIAQAFAECGANVAILNRNHESGKKAAAELEKYGGKFAAFQCDTADINSVRAAAAGVFKFFDHVDVLVNNAGVATSMPFLQDGGLEEWHRVINTNLHGPANTVYEIAPKMVEAGLGGVIINISAIASRTVSSSKNFHIAPYNVSKAGLDIFSRYLAVVLGDHGIRVNSIILGPIHSDLDKQLPEGSQERIANSVPIHRFGEPIEVGSLCVFMTSPAGAMITGANMTFDGGMLCVT